MSSDTAKDPILAILRNCVALSNNMGAAKSWVTRDNPVEKPDVSLFWLQVLSAIPFTGFLGIDHWFARSPLTGLAKMLTFGGFGIWYAWDWAQTWFEPDRVVNYGLSAPLDMQFVSGVGQGMITDKPTVYKTNSSYSLWLFGIIFGFLGIDSLIANNGGQFLRKLIEFVLFAMCFRTVVNVWNTGITFSWICAVIFGSFLASIIIAEYISVLSVVLGGNLFSEGIHFTNKQDKQYNGFFSWLIKNTNFTDERKAEIVKDLQYGGVSAEDIVKMFKIMHPTEVKTEKIKEEAQDGASSSWVSFFLLMASPFLILWNWILYVAGLMFEGALTLTPWGAAMKSAEKLATIAKDTAVEVARAGAGTSSIGKMIPKVALPEPALPKLELPQVPKLEVPSVPTIDLPQVPKSIEIPKKIGFAPQRVRQHGGGEALSAESQIFGAVTVALISGGVIKGLVDYLVAE
jgi:hypothetical protein